MPSMDMDELVQWLRESGLSGPTGRGDEMEVGEQISGTFLLQETEPVALLGALTTFTSGPNKGWILANFAPSSSGFWCDIEASAVSLRMGLEVAIRLASTLLVLASVHRPELNEELAADVGELEIHGRPSGPKMISWKSAKNCPEVTFTTDEEHVKVRLHSKLATALAFQILRQAGQLTAQPALGR